MGERALQSKVSWASLAANCHCDINPLLAGPRCQACMAFEVSSVDKASEDSTQNMLLALGGYLAMGSPSPCYEASQGGMAHLVADRRSDQLGGKGYR